MAINEEQLNIAREFYRDGKYSKAAEHFRKAGKPGQLTEADFAMYIEALSLGGNNYQAEDIMKMLPAKWRDEPKILRARAISAYAQQYYNLSVKEFDRYFVTNKDDMFALDWAMKAACRARKWEKAIKFADIVLSVNETDADALYTAGRSFLALRRDDDAQRCLEKSLQANPANAEAHAALSRMFLLKGDYEKARWHIKETFKTDGSNYLATETLVLLQKERNLFLSLVLSLFWLLFKLPRRIINAVFHFNGWLGVILVIPVFFLWLLSELSFFCMRFDKTLEDQMSVESKSRNAWSLPTILIILVVFSTPRMIRDYNDDVFSRRIAPVCAQNSSSEIDQRKLKEQNELQEQAYIDQYDRSAVGRTDLEPEVLASILEFELRKPVRDPLRTALAVSWLAHDSPHPTAAMMYGYASKIASSGSSKAYSEFFKEQQVWALAGKPSKRLPAAAYTRLNAKPL